MATTAFGLSEKRQALRSRGIGASEIAAVVGLHPSRRPIDVYLEKVGDAEPFEGNKFTTWGNRLERAIAEAWRDDHAGLSIFTPPTVFHRTCRYALCNPDRVVVPQGRRAREAWIKLLEIKNVDRFRASDFGEEGTDDIPEHMLIQVQDQLEVCDMEEAELVPLIGGNDFRSYPIKRDRETGAMLVEAIERFMVDHVLPRIPPAVDGSDAYGKFLSKRFPREQGPLLAPTEEAAQLSRRVAAFRRAEKTITGRKQTVEQRLKALIGEALGFDGICTWKANKAGSEVDLERAAFTLALAWCDGDGAAADKLVAQVVKQFTTSKPGARVLRIAKGE